MRAINKLKNEKSAGIDGIQAEMLKYGRKVAVRKLTHLSNQI